MSRNHINHRIIASKITLHLLFTLVFALLFCSGCGNDPSVSNAGLNNTSVFTSDEQETNSTDTSGSDNRLDSQKDKQDTDLISDHTNDEQTTGYTDYDDVLAYYYGLLSDRSDEMIDEYSSNWLMDLRSISDTYERLDRAGYCFMDITGDGHEELILGAFPCEYENHFEIFNIYEMYEGKVRLLDEGWERNRLFLLDSGSLYNESSSGAGNFEFGEFYLDPSNYKRNWIDYYIADTWEDLKLYHNTTGSYEMSEDDIINATEKDLDSLIDSFRNRIVPIDLIPFSTLIEKYGDPVNCLFYVREDDGYGKKQTLFTLDDPYSVNVIFSAKEDVKNFTYYSLICTDVSDDGTAYYEETPVLNVGDIKRFDDPFILQATFGDVFAQYGFSYVDTFGRTHYFGLYESGKDGSIGAIEYKTENNSSGSIKDDILYISASSTLYWNDKSYPPEQIIDGSLELAWQEGKEGDGEDEYVIIAFDKELTLKGITINAGYQKSEKLYKENGRPKDISITYSDGTIKKYTLNDTFGEQTIVFDDPIKTSSLKITILSVYKGSKYDDTSISEIVLF